MPASPVGKRSGFGRCGKNCPITGPSPLTLECFQAGMAELADAADLKSAGLKRPVGVRVPLSAPSKIHLDHLSSSYPSALIDIRLSSKASDFCKFKFILMTTVT